MHLSLEKTVANGTTTLEVSNPHDGEGGDAQGDAMLAVE